jgi:crotonobetainyl-CoA:carnitine CoA-transferase CaiB-like acyl-CoA transferase
MRGDETSAKVSALGENTAEVLERVGIDNVELEDLRREGVV